MFIKLARRGKDMTEALYAQDAYQTVFTALVVSADGERILLNKTCFYPTGGGQPHDEGVLTCHGKDYPVLGVRNTGDGIVHEVQGGEIRAGDEVRGTIDWKRRYALMRYHTAMHLFSALVYQRDGARITGNQLDVDKARIDLTMENFSKERIEERIHAANVLIKRDARVKTYVLPKEDALKDETLVKLAKKEFFEKLDQVRIVEIEHIDKQADGGTHVRSLKEVGELVLLRIENKGKHNRRVYFTLR